MEKEQDVLGAFSGLMSVNPLDNAGMNGDNKGFDVAESLTDEEFEKIRRGYTNEEKEEEETPTLFEDEPVKKKPGRPKKVKEVEEPAEEEETEEETEEEESVEEVIKKKSKKSNKVEEEQSEEDEPDNTPGQEEVVVTGFFNAIAEKMGWEDVQEDEVPKTAEELIDYMAAVVEENSKPEYSNEEVKKIDEFVRNGGNLKDYLEIDAALDLDNIKLEDNDQACKQVLREFLKEKGFSKAQIDKKINKYEEADILEDEAEDALEGLTEIREKKKEQLLLDQEKEAERVKADQQKLFSDVVTQIKDLDQIRGIKIPEKDKKVLIEYIFKPASNGKTKYHQDYASNYVKNLIESAYFTMKGDTLITAAKQEGSTSAVNKFKQSLNTQKDSVVKKSKKQIKSSDDSIWGSIARSIRG